MSWRERFRGESTPPSLFDSLFIFAVLDATPDPEKLEQEARNRRRHPSSSLFGAAHLDDEGKVVTNGCGRGPGDIDASVIRQQIAQAEGMRRHAVAGAR